MAYSDYFSFGTGPEIKTGTAQWRGAYGAEIRKQTFDYVGGGSGNTKADAAFDEVMAGHDAATKGFTDQLTDIYNSYGEYATNYEGKIQPIIDALTGDIENIQGVIGDYSEAVEGSKDTFLNGVVVDPDASRMRAKYGADIDANFNAAREGLDRDMISQGLNPYANKGSRRQLAMEKAKSKSGAQFDAYTDWQGLYNDAMEKKQRGTAAYLGLKGDEVGMNQGIMNARGSLANMHRGVLDAKVSTGREKAKGIEGLASLAEARRAESLGLGQQKQDNARQAEDVKQQLTAKLTSRDKTIAAGGSDAYGGRYFGVRR